ncbi:MAG: 50S ribosomal protein L3 [Cryobacterium sp.]|nr:50S ribosomal protein L3 [Oligoflexia bacterium]
MSENIETTTPENTNSVAASGKGQSVKFDLGRGGLFGVKAGMTQVYTSDGSLLAVTVIDLRANVITQVKTKAKEGYNALQVSLLERKAKSTTKPELGHFKKAGVTGGFYYTKEFRLPATSKMDGFAIGNELNTEFVKEGDLVDLIAVSKGKGFQGGVKRYHMAGSAASHGNSVTTRSLGSIGNRADPAKCFKNKKMPGQMGNVQVTVQNVMVVKVDAENGMILVNGSVPGSKSGIVAIRKAIKPMIRAANKARK